MMQYPMKVTLQNIWKSYETEWVIRNMSYEFTEGNSYAILGPNGSGKSTLLQVITGMISPSKGTINYQLHDNEVKVEDIYQHLGFSSPYQQLIEEFTLMEQVQFHSKFRPFIGNLSPMEVLLKMDLEKHGNKQIRNFSSGMKQRVKLALSILGQSDLVLLDEPATNLDERGVRWFHDLLNENLNSRLLIVSANRIEEYDFCNVQLNVMDWK